MLKSVEGSSRAETFVPSSWWFWVGNVEKFMRIKLTQLFSNFQKIKVVPGSARLVLRCANPNHHGDFRDLVYEIESTRFKLLPRGPKLLDDHHSPSRLSIEPPTRSKISLPTEGPNNRTFPFRQEAVKMGSDLLLGIRLDLQTLRTIRLSNVNLITKVEELRDRTADEANLPKDSFELVYRGCVLEDDATMESCGLKSGVTVHVLGRKKPAKPTPAKSITEGSILQLAAAFGSFNENAASRSALHRLSKRPEVIENIISTSPGLNEDSVSIAMLQDPDLMAHFTDADTVRRIAELHPVLVEAAQSIAAAVDEEARTSLTMGGGNASTGNVPSTAYSYSLDNLSDDEEMAGDSSQSSDSAAQPNLQGGYDSSNSAITTAQLAAALSRAGARGFSLSASSSSTSGGGTSATGGSGGTSGGSNSGLITTEMFTRAIQQAFASAPTPPTPPTPPTSSAGPALPHQPHFQLANLDRQLAQMREIGLEDDAVNVQALRFTNGDVQAAIELVFGGFGEN